MQVARASILLMIRLLNFWTLDTDAVLLSSLIFNSLPYSLN